MLSAINLAKLSDHYRSVQRTATQRHQTQNEGVSSFTIINISIWLCTRATKQLKNAKMHRQNAMLFCDFAFLLVVGCWFIFFLPIKTDILKQRRPIYSLYLCRQRRIHLKRMTSHAEWLFLSVFESDVCFSIRII